MIFILEHAAEGGGGREEADGELIEHRSVEGEQGQPAGGNEDGFVVATLLQVHDNRCHEIFMEAWQ